MKKCKSCGGVLRELANGDYKCRCCGQEFSADEFAGDGSRQTSQRSATVSRVNEGVNVFEKNQNGAMEITCNFITSASAGSGLLIDAEGYAVTNTHVVTGPDYSPCRHITVRIAGEQVKAEVVALGDKMGGNGRGVDLALLKLARVPAGAVVIELGNFDDVRIGEQVFVIGNSLGDGTCITSGIVSDKQRVLGGHTLMMTDCAINGGNSGGPIFNALGVAIGVIVSSRVQRDGSATEGMNYAIPMNIVKDFIAANHPRGFAAASAAMSVACGTKVPPRAERRPAKCPCPKCGEWAGDIENNIFYCNNCGHEGG